MVVSRKPPQIVHHFIHTTQEKFILLDRIKNPALPLKGDNRLLHPSVFPKMFGISKLPFNPNYADRLCNAGQSKQAK
jgi:hypothetical protein